VSLLDGESLKVVSPSADGGAGRSWDVPFAASLLVTSLLLDDSGAGTWQTQQMCPW
jgi:hypothetical protein